MGKKTEIESNPAQKEDTLTKENEDTETKTPLSKSGLSEGKIKYLNLFVASFCMAVALLGGFTGTPLEVASIGAAIFNYGLFISA